MERADSTDAGFHNALAGVDGSPGGRGAVALASELIVPGGRLTLAHVHAHALSPGADLSFNALGREESQRLLERERDATGATASLVSVASISAGRGLHELAEEQGCDLLAVGSSSAGAVGHVLLGDHTRSALNGAPCAVAVSPHGYEKPGGHFRVIGVGYNGSPESEAALVLARGLAARTGAVVRALSADSGESRTVEGAELRTVDGDAAEELAAFSEGLDLLVVGSRGYGPVRRLMLGSTSLHLARTARCPLLVLPRGAHGTS